MGGNSMDLTVEVELTLSEISVLRHMASSKGKNINAYISGATHNYLEDEAFAILKYFEKIDLLKSVEV